MILAYAIIIPLTTGLSVAGKGILHAAIGFAFLIWFFKIWSTFKQNGKYKVLASIILLSVFIIALPIAIDLVSFLPIVLKGIAHLLVILLFFGVFLYIWRKPENR